MIPQHLQGAPRACRVAVVIATKGRPQAVPRMLRLLEQQTLQPSIVVISANTRLDVGEFAAPQHLPVEYLFGPAGLPAQRNRGLERVLPESDIVVFLDDDFVPAREWLARCADAFAARPHAVGVTGGVVQDGVRGDAIDWDEAAELLSDDAAHPQPMGLVPVQKLYGCNMAYRCSAIGDLRFDERLVLYGWLEDMDFSRAMHAKGPLLQVLACRGVHLGLRSGGRTSGKRFGFSQIVNAWYLYGKGALSAREAWSYTARAFLANGAKALFPEPHIDRRGRLAGNLLGLRELLSGRCQPERGAEL
ncbi:UNVERIFIED_CONTAM: glycosyltransferase [Microbacterium sp. SLM126]|uniref:glycosyltransferase family 2 protein n=1 Tax=unclassified Cupriavidus TaxID=2640874 RepID=UPI0028B67176|nr:glycosyltransferase [Cupriavidus sp. SZY C1]MDT6963863.1 glycosyltransferase [Cupriavidus sp. SZY C1]